MPEISDRENIEQTVTDYVHGMCRADAKLLEHSMHPSAACIGHFDGGLEWSDRQGFINDVLGAVEVPDTDPWFQIDDITITGDTAAVRVQDIWLGMHFDDMLTLLNHDDRWVIVNKVFYHRVA